MEDGKIIELYYRRDQAAIGETDKKYGPRCRSLAYNILSNPEDTEECVSDTYLAAWNRIPPEYPVSLCAWLISIVRRISLSRLRRRYADRRGGGEYALCYEELDECIKGGGDPQGDIEARELAEGINRALDKLSKTDRCIFLSRYWLMEPVADIAEAMNFSQSKVKSSLHRSREKLRKQLCKEGLI
ncbi:MAG: sigma-70 family RNA polymerase sigma factor [Oscillospiraceae bacterium]|nr:sigma-70 family RNA polymerase sigma factor [Oscillospiraceae bacterium]